MKFNPLYHPLILTKPVRRSSIWDTTPFFPFMAYLVSALRPVNYYEIGVLLGESLSYMCQLSGTQPIPFKCVGIDLFEDVTDTQCASVYGFLPHQHGIKDLREYLSNLLSQYNRFMEIIKHDSATYAANVPDSSVDFLFIDGDHSYNGVKRDFDAWLPKMSPRGIIMFHDTRSMHTIENISVETFFNEQAANFPHFKLDFGAGVGILAIGKDINPEIAMLCDNTNPERDLIVQFFRNAGLLQLEVVRPTYTPILPKAEMYRGYLTT